MQQSMTGYGQSEGLSRNFHIKAEIKSLNSKFLDFTARLSKEFSSKEIEIRNLVTEKIKRGKVMLFLELTPADEVGEANIRVDESLFKAYHQKFSDLAKEVGAAEDDVLKIALQSPNVVKQHEPTDDQIPWKEVFENIVAATDRCVHFRKKEGLVLENKLKEYITNIQSGLEAVEKEDEVRIANVRTRLQKHVDDIRDKVQVDENRFEQELIYYLERIDISEEKVRLRQHLDYFSDVLSKEDAAGKKLGFIAQEMGREINTIGSKANDSEIQRVVVRMKDDLEKIKEQTLNIL